MLESSFRVSLFKYLLRSLPCTACRHILCCRTGRFSLGSSFVDTKYFPSTLSLFIRTNWPLLALCFLVNHGQQAKRGLLIMAASGLDGLCLALNKPTTPKISRQASQSLTLTAIVNNVSVLCELHSLGLHQQ